MLNERGAGNQMFGRKKVKRILMGVLYMIGCPCGESGWNQKDVDADEVVEGYSSGDLAKCAYCGRIFVWGLARQDDGKLVGQGRATHSR